MLLRARDSVARLVGRTHATSLRLAAQRFIRNSGELFLWCTARRTTFCIVAAAITGKAILFFNHSARPSIEHTIRHPVSYHFEQSNKDLDSVHLAIA